MQLCCDGALIVQAAALWVIQSRALTYRNQVQQRALWGGNVTMIGAALDWLIIVIAGSSSHPPDQSEYMRVTALLCADGGRLCMDSLFLVNTDSGLYL